MDGYGLKEIVERNHEENKAINIKILEQTTKTNGRVTSLEDTVELNNLDYQKTKAVLYAVWITISVILIPTLFLVVQIYFSRK